MIIILLVTIIIGIIIYGLKNGSEWEKEEKRLKKIIQEKEKEIKQISSKSRELSDYRILINMYRTKHNYMLDQISNIINNCHKWAVIRRLMTKGYIVEFTRFLESDNPRIYKPCSYRIMCYDMRESSGEWESRNHYAINESLGFSKILDKLCEFEEGIE